MHKWPTAKSWPVSNRFNQSETVSKEVKHFLASVFQKSVLFVQISSFNQHKAAWSSLDKLVPCLNNHGCMRSGNKALSRHPLLLCVQTERQTSFSGGAVAYIVYRKTQFDTKTYPYRSKMFQLLKKLHGFYGFMNLFYKHTETRGIYQTEVSVCPLLASLQLTYSWNIGCLGRINTNLYEWHKVKTHLEIFLNTPLAGCFVLLYILFLGPRSYVHCAPSTQ